MNTIIGPNGKRLERPCERCGGSGAVTIKVTEEEGKPQVNKSVVCPVCRGTKVKSTIIGK